MLIGVISFILHLIKVGGYITEAGSLETTLISVNNIFSKDGNSKKIFWTLFFIRVGVLLFFDIFVTTFIAVKIPVIELVLTIPISGETRTLFYDHGKIPCTSIE